MEPNSRISELYEEVAKVHYSLMARRLIDTLQEQTVLENELSIKRIQKHFPGTDPATLQMIHAVAVATLKTVAQQNATYDYQMMLLRCPDDEAVQASLLQWIENYRNPES